MFSDSLQKMLPDIGKQVQLCWKELGFRLGLKSHDIEELQASAKTPDESRAKMEMLRRWQLNHRHDADILLALSEVGRPDLVAWLGKGIN